jgi:excisionase family DNA binding protein
MSSNIQIQRICKHCGKEFTARTTITLYCSHRCNSAAYKQKIRNGKVEQSNKETLRIKNQPIEELKSREFLTVTQVSRLIGCSRQNVYNLINDGKLKATNILLKKTIVKRSDLDQLFNKPTHDVLPESKPETQKQELKQLELTSDFDFSNCYNLSEVNKKYGISETALQNLIKRFEIPKIKKGWYAYVPKKIIDTLLS